MRNTSGSADISGFPHLAVVLVKDGQVGLIVVREAHAGLAERQPVTARSAVG